MSKISFVILFFLILSGCSLKDHTKIIKFKERKVLNDNNPDKEKIQNNEISKELNPELVLDFSQLLINDNFYDNKNNIGSQNYNGDLDKIGAYKFSKFNKPRLINYEPIFLNDGLIFFDKKGTIIRFDKSQKIVWKKNHYSKIEKKLKPKLLFAIKGQNLIVADNIAKYYSIDIKTGELNWIKNNFYPFNSSIKIHKDKFFIVDYKNTLRCYYILDGSECWNLQTDNSFAISNIKYSINILNDMIYFNNSIGDVTAVNIESGIIIWQLPTQSSSIYNETFNFKISKLVSDGKSIYFSNNKSEFYSIDIKTGTTNWIKKINSTLKPINIDNLIFTISKKGHLFVIEKNNGNVLRKTDLYKNFKPKKREEIEPIGFVIGGKNLYLTNSNGTLIKSNIEKGNILQIEKISKDKLSQPFIFNKNLFVIKNGSVLQFN